MNRADIEPIVARGESGIVEFKRSTGQLTRAGETLCGMLNGAGGVVLLGVTDSGEIVGQIVADSTLQKLAAMLRDFEPQAPIRVDRVGVEGERELLALHAEPMPGLGPWTYRGRAWQRVGATTSPMPQAEYLRHFLDRGQGVTAWEKMPALGCSIDDLDPKQTSCSRKP
ncbi:MAG: ATP-binding protein [Oligoflexia bacterium]|nr:ATP-binding protein [Oligoflexia bacterium]